MKKRMKRIIFMTLGLVLFSCVTKLNYTQRTFHPAETKENEKIEMSYQVPTITPTATTKHSQEKGGVMISVEALPFHIERKITTNREAIRQDPKKQSFDRFEIKEIPSYNINEGHIQFKIRIRNNENVPLRLSAIGFALIIDGTQWSFPEEQIQSWDKGMVLTGFEKEYIIDGPMLNSLKNAQVVYVLLNGVPTSYDKAGNITQKSNFEWYYECSLDDITKEDVITYTYESSPIRVEQCTSCRGSGKNPTAVKCSRCDGHGKLKASNGAIIKCRKCSGTGKIYPTCKGCYGIGNIKYPESMSPEIAESVSWYGWKVQVKSIPSGATIYGWNPKTGENKQAVRPTPFNGAWYRTTKNPCPITLEYNGQKVMVMPLKPDGKPSPKILVDFTGSTPKVIKGKDVTQEYF